MGLLNNINSGASTALNATLTTVCTVRKTTTGLCCLLLRAPEIQKKSALLYSNTTSVLVSAHSSLTLNTTPIWKLYLFKFRQLTFYYCVKITVGAYKRSCFIIIICHCTSYLKRFLSHTCVTRHFPTDVSLPTLFSFTVHGNI